MPSHARIVIPGLPHHIIQRGNRRQKVFFCDDDRRLYVRLLTKYSKKAGVNFWAYCLMENHVHFIAVPSNKNSLSAVFGSTHKAYTKIINEREGWKGFLWQGRFLSHPLEEKHLIAAFRYVELNPVRAGIVQSAWEYPWSSAKAHVMGSADPLIRECFLIDEYKNWRFYLEDETTNCESEIFRAHAKNGLPLGDEQFVLELERRTGKKLHKEKPGPK